MRLESLRLVRFGAYTERAIDELAPGLNLLTGANEAGKSTLLGALAFGLFGAECRDYVPDEGKREVRLGLWRDGRPWELTRADSRGQGAFTLRSAGEVVLAPDYRTHWLAGTTLAQYRSLYALTLDDLGWCEDLREVLLLAETGSLGVGLREAQRAADRAATELFSPESRVKPLNAALAAWRDTERAVRQLSTAPAQLEAQRRALATAESDARALADEQARALRAAEQLAELVRALPQWDELMALRRREAELSEFADFPPSAPADLAAALASATAAERDLREARAAADAARLELAQRPAEDRWLVQAEPVVALQERALALAEWPAQVRAAEEQAAREHAAAAALAAQGCGPAVAVETLAQLDVSALVSSARATHESALAAASQALGWAEQSTRTAERACEQARLALASAADKWAALPPPSEATPLETLLQATAEQPVLAARLAAARSAQLGASARLLELQRQQEPARDATPQRAWLGVLAAGLLAYGAFAVSARQFTTGAVDLLVGVGLLVLVLARRSVTMPASAEEASLATAHAALAEADSTVSELQARQAELASRAGLPPTADDDAWNRLRQELARRTAQAQTEHEQRTRLADQLELLRAGLRAATEQQSQAQADWQARQTAADVARSAWQGWLLERGLPAELTPEGARIWFDTARTVQQHEAAATAAADLAAARRAELDELVAQADALALALGAERPASGPAALAAARIWSAALATERSRAAERAAAHERLAAAESAAAAAEHRHAEAVAARAATLARAGAADADALARRATLAAEHAAVLARGREAAARLRGARDDSAWQALQEALAQLDRAELLPAHEAAVARVEALAARLREAHGQAAVQADAVERLQTEGALAEALLRREQQWAEVRRLAEQWAVQRVAHTLLDVTLRRHEAERQSERVVRVGQLLAELTDGRWQGVLAREGRLLAVGAAGPRDEARLSRGTRDALFLCARLAALETQLERCPLPVALDDPLVNLDPRRAERLVGLLADLARRTQVLLFTCHETTAAQVRARVPDVRTVALSEGG